MSTAGAGDDGRDVLPADQLDLWKALIRVSQLLPRALDDDLTRRGASLPTYEILAVLGAHPGGLRMTEVGHYAQVSKPRLSVHVSELESAGLIRRQADPTDGRARILSLTPAGRSRLRRLTAPHLRLACSLVADNVPVADQPAVLRSLAAILTALGDTWRPSPAAAEAPTPGT